MAQPHRLLARQVRRYLKDADTASVPGLDRLLHAVSSAYEGHDEDRRLLERAMDISSRELSAAEQELRSVLEALPDEFLVMDARGKVLEHRSGSDAILCTTRSPIGRNL
jgi:PAS domain-containing protein